MDIGRLLHSVFALDKKRMFEKGEIENRVSSENNEYY